MILAVKTTTSSAGLWVIVVVAVGCVALWLYLVEVHATRRGTPQRRSDAEVTRDDLPQVPWPRPDSDRVAADGPGAGQPEGNRAGTTARDGGAAQDAGDPAVQWTPPAQRQSPTDQPAPAEPRQGRRGGGPQQPG